MSLFFICSFLWIHVLIAMCFSGRKQSREKVTQTGRGGKSKALYFSGFWVKRLSVNIPVIRKILGKFKTSSFPFSTFLLSTAADLAWSQMAVWSQEIWLWPSWQEGKMQRQALSLARHTEITISAAHCCSQLLLLVISSSHNGSGNIKGIKTKSCGMVVHFY